ncbi:MAG: hypothetical protein LBC80_07965 [Treponema sp.]|jgi:hypothetical protein|nr:hypothetical protein [Treponema sp.]
MQTKKNTTSTPTVNSVKANPHSGGGLRLIDFLVVIVFLSIALYCINLFRLDLMQTFYLRNVEPVGQIVIRQNIVQRRLSDRVLWDRLAAQSPVYLGDLIRVAEYSAATLFLEGNSIELNENTLIRLSRAADGETLQIIMNQGTISVATTEDSQRISLDIGGRHIQPLSAEVPTVLNITSADNIIILQVNEGTVQVIEEQQTQEIQAGSFVAIEPETIEPAEVRLVQRAIVLQPVSNARYLNSTNNPIPVNFNWNRININANDLLRLEIASDRNFNHIYHVYENLNNQALVNVNSGLWHWRLSSTTTVLGEGQITVVDASGPQLQSPMERSVFNFVDDSAVFNFQWNEVHGASAYILEICNTPYFTNPYISRETEVTFFTDSSLTEGRWYWRVKPVFPSFFSGNASFSLPSSFLIEQKHVNPQVEELPLSDWLAIEISPEIAQLPGELPIEEEIPVTEVAALVAPTPAPRPAPISPLLAAQNLRPARGHRFTTTELQEQRRITFTWQAVRGANAYIFTLFQQTTTGRQQLLQTQPLSSPEYELTDLRILDAGNFIWQIEAVSLNQNGVIERRGTTAESTFIMYIYFPGAIQLEGVEVFFEN